MGTTVVEEDEEAGAAAAAAAATKGRAAVSHATCETCVCAQSGNGCMSHGQYIKSDWHGADLVQRLVQLTCAKHVLFVLTTGFCLTNAYQSSYIPAAQHY